MEATSRHFLARCLLGASRWRGPGCNLWLDLGRLMSCTPNDKSSSKKNFSAEEAQDFGREITPARSEDESTGARSLSLPRALSRFLVFSPLLLSLSLSLSIYLSLSPSLTHTRTQTHTLSQVIVAHQAALFTARRKSLSHSLTHSLTLSLSHTHSLSLSAQVIVAHEAEAALFFSKSRSDSFRGQSQKSEVQ